MQIKARMLLPKPDPPLPDEDEADPRAELARQLAEYSQFKAASEILAEREAQWQQVFCRPLDAIMQDRAALPAEPELPLNVSPQFRLEVKELWKALARILERQKRSESEVMAREKVTLPGQLENIRSLLRQGEISFQAIFAEKPSRLVIVVTFLALLELIRLGEVEIRQTENFGDILIEGHKHEA